MVDASLIHAYSFTWCIMCCCCCRSCIWERTTSHWEIQLMNIFTHALTHFEYCLPHLCSLLFRPLFRSRSLIFNTLVSTNTNVLQISFVKHVLVFHWMDNFSEGKTKTKSKTDMMNTWKTLMNIIDYQSPTVWSISKFKQSKLSGTKKFKSITGLWVHCS